MGREASVEQPHERSKAIATISFLPRIWSRDELRRKSLVTVLTRSVYTADNRMLIQRHARASRRSSDAPLAAAGHRHDVCHIGLFVQHEPETHPQAMVAMEVPRQSS